jgi:murein tripeptide amidase MpaA
MPALRGCSCATLILALSGAALAQPDAGTAGGDIARFDGHRVVRVEIDSARALQTALALTDDLWSHRITNHADIRVSPEQFAALQQSGLRFTVAVPELQALIDAEAAAVRAHRLLDDPQWYTSYHTYDEIRTYCQQMAAAYPQLAQVVTVGNSLENRQIFGLRITGPGTVTRPGVLIHAAQHAREWATPPTAVYLAEQLLMGYGSDPVATHILNTTELFVVPISNPDGYVYTWTNNRLWRKNRRPTGGTCNAQPSYGVDLNRNWGYQWGGEGASTSRCDDTYRGPNAFSEPETQALRDFAIAHPNIVGHHDIHSYSQLVMSPWGYTAALPPSPDQQFFVATNAAMAQAIFGLFGRQYEHGPIYTTIYPASGTSVDWMYGARAIKSFTTEVRPADPQPGFLLPASEILPNAQENYLSQLQLILALSPLPPACYANCDASTAPPVLNVGDFTCFLQRFAAGESYANCDNSTAPPMLNVGDFTCFLQRFAAGCP